MEVLFFTGVFAMKMFGWQYCHRRLVILQNLTVSFQTIGARAGVGFRAVNIFGSLAQMGRAPDC